MLFHPETGVKEQEPILERKYKEVACLSWINKSGRVYPVLIKMEDEDEVIQTFDRIRVLRRDEKNYSGIISNEFECEMIVSGLSIIVLLVFYPERMKWYMVQK